MTSDIRGPGGPWELSRDRKAVGRYPTDTEAVADLHRLVGYSAHHAIKHEGWSLEKNMKDENREFLEDQRRWPNWPRQTMKRRSGGHSAPEVATLVDRDGGELVLVEKNIALLTNEDIEDAEPTTVDAVLDAGWVVD